MFFFRDKLHIHFAIKHAVEKDGGAGICIQC